VRPVKVPVELDVPPGIIVYVLAPIPPVAVY